MDQLWSEMEGFLSTANGRFGAPGDDQRLHSWLPLREDTFARRFAAVAEVRRPSASMVSDMATFQRGARSRHIELLTRQLELETRLAGLVEDAYGLTAEERALLRATRPVRDPIDVLGARILGIIAAQRAMPYANVEEA